MKHKFNYLTKRSQYSIINTTQSSELVYVFGEENNKVRNAFLHDVSPDDIILDNHSNLCDLSFDY
jgi:tRNA(Leu) C34 or U34 (ribose-2'-O)-methylase TrmL